MKRERSFVRTYLILLISLLVLCAGITVFIDPYFHYHAPLENMSYEYRDSRYMNPGIAKNFTYSGIIAGTSMAANFHTQEASCLFGIQFAKMIFNGGSYHEIGTNIRRALDNNSDISLVIQVTDPTRLIQKADSKFHGIKDAGYLYPWYLYDDNLFTDVEYCFNKTTLIDSAQVILHTLQKTPKFDMNKYACDASNHHYSSSNFTSFNYDLSPGVVQQPLTDTEVQLITENVTQNIIKNALAYENVDFYIILPPYSALYWKDEYEKGNLIKIIDSLALEVSLLAPYKNIKLYSFYEETDITCNLDLYYDLLHYDESVNSLMLQSIIEDKHQLTLENYSSYFEMIREIYMYYDYPCLLNTSSKED